VSDRFRVVPAAYVVFRREHDGRTQVLLQLRRGTGYMDGFWATAAARGTSRRTSRCWRRPVASRPRSSV
jgi:hypothetical protein